MIVLTIEASLEGDSASFRVSSDDVADAPDPPRIDADKLADLGRRSQMAQELGDSDGKLAEIGRELFDIAFAGANRNLFVRAHERASASRQPLLLRVSLDSGSDLQKLGWEWLHDGRRFVACDPRSALVRWFRAQDPVGSLLIEPPLRVLLTTATSGGRKPIDAVAEEKVVRAGLSGFGDSARLTVEPDLSIEQLESIWRDARNRKTSFHLWHHCGHGGVKDGAFRLALEGKDRAVDFLDMARLGRILGAESGLRVALFQTCFSGSRPGLTRALAELQVPVVIGFQRELLSGSAVLFARAFYSTLLHRPVEFAVTEGRISLADREWSEVVAVSRRRDAGVLLKVDGSAPSETSQQRALRRQRMVLSRYLEEKRQAS